jgi:hypothetical protein
MDRGCATKSEGMLNMDLKAAQYKRVAELVTMSPMAQLVGAESEIIDFEEKLHQPFPKRRSARIPRTYYAAQMGIPSGRMVPTRRA